MSETRGEMTIEGRRLSYLDFGGAGRPLLALHGHMDQGRAWTELSRALAPEWRVIAPDQRGHGESDRAAEYSRDGYIADAVALLDHLGLQKVVILGHSMDTVYKFAARHPERVDAMVNVDAPVENGAVGSPSKLSFVTAWPYQAATREELLQGLGPAAPMFAGVLREMPDGTWRLPFHPEDIVASEAQGHGDHWADWLASACPALLINGTSSQALPAEQAQEMAARRPGTRLVELDTDHFVHTADPEGLAKAVREFLKAP